MFFLAVQVILAFAILPEPQGLQLLHGYNSGEISYPAAVCVPPTVINLSFFTAIPKSGKVILQWNTEAETDNAGFNLYRSEIKDGEYEDK